MDLSEFHKELERICKNVMSARENEDRGTECTAFREVRTTFSRGVDMLFERGHCGRRPSGVHDSQHVCFSTLGITQDGGVNQRKNGMFSCY